MAGFDNDTMYATNWDFRGATPIVGQGGGAGILPIGTGSGTAPFIKAGTLTSPDASVTINYNDPNIELTTSFTGFTWNEVTGTSQALSVNNGYIGNNGGTITMTLPATASIGDEICFAQKGAGVITVAQNAGQTIHTTTADTTTGVTGSLSTIDRWSSFCLICVTEDTDWMLKSGSHGSLLVV